MSSYPEKSHPLIQLLAGHLVKEEQEYPDALRSLQETFHLIGLDKISHIDLSNISDIVDVSNISQGEQQAVSQPVANENPDEQFHVFARTSSVRSSQIAGSINQFLSGTSFNTIGPFIINDRPPFWIDFIRTQRSIALFIQGNPTPILYFKISLNIRPGLLSIPKLPTYSIVPTSVWIQAKSFQPFVPPELYAGLKISSGTLHIGGNFTTSQTGIILDPGATFSCDLNLVQKELPTNLTTGQYGKDSLDASVQLPAEFSFTNNGITKVSSATTTLFSNTLSAPDNTAPNSKYFEQQMRIGLSLNLTEDPLINITETQSPLVDVSGQAPINNICWA